MATLKIIAAFATVLLAQKIVAVHSATYHEDFEVRYDFSDGRITYAACRRSLSSDNTKLCDVKAEKSLNRSDTFFCNFTLHTFPGLGPQNFNWSIKRLGEDKIIVKLNRFVGDCDDKLAIVQLPDCNTSYIELHNEDDLRDDGIITYLDTFDVFYLNSELCGDDLCRMTVDGHGKIMEGPIGFIKNYGYYQLPAFNSISETSPDQGFIIVNTTINEDIMHSLLKPDGSEKLLAKLDLNGYGLSGDPGAVISNKYNYITVCSTLMNFHEIWGVEGVEGIHRYMSLNCTQYDKSGSIIFETSTVKFLEDYQWHDILFIHNLREGGFVLGFSIISSESSTVYQYLTKINSMGKEVGVGITEDVTHKKWYSLFENSNGEICLLKESKNATWQLIRDRFEQVCYDDNDFKPGGFVSFDIKMNDYPLLFKFCPVINSGLGTDKLNHSPQCSL